MLEYFSNALLISYYPPLLLAATIFIFFTGFIYGNAVSFIFGIRKTLTIGFFVVVLATIFILIFSSIYVLTTQCASETGGPLCSDSMSIVARALSSLMLLLSHLFINLVIGHTGVFLGIALYYPSEWFLKKYTKVPLPKKSVEEFEKITASQQTVTKGTISLEGMRQDEANVLPRSLH